MKHYINRAEKLLDKIQNAQTIEQLDKLLKYVANLGNAMFEFETVKENGYSQSIGRARDFFEEAMSWAEQGELEITRVRLIESTLFLKEAAEKYLW